MTRMMITAIIIILANFSAMGVQHQPPHAEMPMAMDCPMKVQDAELSVADIENGVALTFTTTAETAVTELRRRVEKMADMKHRGMTKHHAIPPFTARYEEIPNGARLELTPEDPQALEEFRTKVREHAEQMKKGECSMMQEMMHGMMMHWEGAESEAMEDAGHDTHQH